MAKYKTKPFEIEAVLFDGENWDEVKNFVGQRPSYSTKNGIEIYIVNFQEAGTYVAWDDDSIVAEVYDKLHATWVGVKAGQYIIKGMKGEFYPCDPEVFETKYEPKFATGGVIKNPIVLIANHELVIYKDGTMMCQRVVSPPKEIDDDNEE